MSNFVWEIQVLTDNDSNKKININLNDIKINWKPDTIIEFKNLISILKKGHPIRIVEFIDRSWD